MEWNGKMFFQIFVFLVFHFSLFFSPDAHVMDDRSEQQNFYCMNLYSICLQLSLNSNQLDLNSIEFKFNAVKFECWIELNLISTRLTHFCHHFIVISAQQGGAHVLNCTPIPEHHLTLIPETLNQARAPPLFHFKSSNLCDL
jgi:hypothetical protein